MSQHPQFALFVSSVEGSLVTRYGTATFIGAERSATDPRAVEWHPDQVVAIPHDEYRKFRREYLRALREGSLVERTADEWNRQNTAAAEAPAERTSKRSEQKPHDDPARRRPSD